ncbi:MAG: succinylglutamate desuccinylase/aspartoacylase family protein [Halobacteriovoraceae bacterium]|nr:succinylglutamate desuccinylase/aspartoacylase family protein [Halobacteriovoraceae bacterium]
MEKVLVVKAKEDLKMSSLKKGEVHRLHIHLSDNALGVPWRVPVIIIRGVSKGPVVGITAALHGNELNGIPTIFKLINEIDPKKLAGTVAMVPISNVPAYLKNQRYFSDNVDLNRIMPGKPEGATSQLYAYSFINKIAKKFDYLLDLHTASHGRVNSLYIRADLDNDETRTLAYLQHPQIIVSKDHEMGTLRSWANHNNKPAITIEIGNPNSFQHDLIDETLDGILNTLRYFKMITGKVRDMVTNATVCDHSYWIYSKKGGIVDVLPKLAEKIRQGQLIANVYDVFGNVREKIYADRNGIVIGKNTRPNCDAGTRLLHLGVDILEPSPETIPGHKDFNDNWIY